MKARSAFWRDALLLKELRTRMRSRMAMGMVSLYACAMSLLAVWLYTVSGGFSSALASEIGVSLFGIVCWIVLWVIILIAPLVAAGSVSGERDHKTLDSLMAAPISTTRVIAAKLAACLAYFAALLFLSVPVFSVSFIMGGVSPGEILAVFLTLAAIAVWASCVGMYFSTYFQRSLASIPVASVVVIGISLVVVYVFEGAGAVVIRMVSPLAQIELVTEGGSFSVFGYDLPGMVPCIMWSLLVASWLFEAARQNLTFPVERRFCALRLLFGLAVVVIWTATVGGIVSDVAEMDPAPSLQFWLGRVAVPILMGLTVFLLIVTPWVSSSSPVTYSDLDAEKRGVVHRFRSLRAWVLDGARFMVLLAVLMIGIALFAMRVVNTPWSVMTRAAFTMSAGIMPVVLAMACAGRWLSGRGSAVRRWVGMSITYVLFLGSVLVSMAVSGALLEEASERSALFQWGFLLSPAIGGVWLRMTAMLRLVLPAVAKAQFEPLLVPCLFYLAIASILSVPAYVLPWIHARGNGTKRQDPDGKA